MRVLDQALVPGPYFFGEQLTICDFLLGLQAVWDEISPRDISSYAHIEQLVTRMRERESIRYVLRVHAEAKRKQRGRH